MFVHSIIDKKSPYKCFKIQIYYHTYEIMTSMSNSNFATIVWLVNICLPMQSISSTSKVVSTTPAHNKSLLYTTLIYYEKSVNCFSLFWHNSTRLVLCHIQNMRAISFHVHVYTSWTNHIAVFHSLHSGIFNRTLFLFSDLMCFIV